MICNRAEAADALGVSRTTIDDWVRDGAPVIEKPGRKGVESKYDTGALFRWRIRKEAEKARAESDGADLDALRARKLELDAEFRALQLAKEKGEVCNLAELERALSTIVIHCRTQLLALPQRLAPLLVGETDETRLKQVIQAEVRQALTELSNDNVEQVLQEVSEW